MISVGRHKGKYPFDRHPAALQKRKKNTNPPTRKTAPIMAKFCRAIDDEKCHWTACGSRAKRYAKFRLRVISIRPIIINNIPKTIFHPKIKNDLRA